LVPDQIVVFAADGTPLYSNQVSLTYFAMTIEELRESVTDIRRTFRRFAHPEDVETFVAAWERGLAGTAPWETEVRFRRGDGEYRWFLVRSIPLRDDEGRIIRWYNTATDIDDRKKAEDKIRQQEGELREIVDLVPHHIAVTAPDGRFTYGNHVMLDYYGLTTEDVQDAEIEGLVRRFMHPDDRKTFSAAWERGFVGTALWEIEARFRRHDGEYRWVLVRFIPLHDDGGRIVRWYITGTDIDDRKKTEERAHQETLSLREELDKAGMFEDIIGTSQPLRAVLANVSHVAPTDSTVLITGETGTGKELVARAIHKGSARASHPFVSVNCAATPPALIASDLFGHEKGAFTGALQRRPGRFELADRGTIFLDEVGDLPPDTQLALLRVLQEREFERVGGTRSIRVDVRVIAATNRDLQAAMAAGTFRSDLFYRLNVFPIDLPPLRERRQDVPLLAAYFLDRYAPKMGKKIGSFDERTLEVLRGYSWPGNIRELQNVIERSVIVCETDTLSIDDSWLPRESREPQRAVQSLADDLAAREREAIEQALAASGGRVAGPSGAAAKLGIRGSTLESKIKAFGIKKERFKGS
jgi:formate hydrogenlyase transcriptional activator